MKAATNPISEKPNPTIDKTDRETARRFSLKENDFSLSSNKKRKTFCLFLFEYAI